MNLYWNHYWQRHNIQLWGATGRWISKWIVDKRHAIPWFPSCSYVSEWLNTLISSLFFIIFIFDVLFTLRQLLFSFNLFKIVAFLYGSHKKRRKSGARWYQCQISIPVIKQWLKWLSVNCIWMWHPNVNFPLFFLFKDSISYQ